MNKRILNARVIQLKRMGILVVSFALAACSNKSNVGLNQVKEYAVITLESANSELNNSYPATIRGKQDIEIRPKVPGFITKLCVEEGSSVKKGQTLFVIDTVQYQAAVEVAKANVEVAITSLETSDLTYRNKKELRSKNIISDYELQMAKNDLATRKAQLDQSKAQLLNARNDLSYTNVVSPSDGVAGTIPYRVGSLVSSSTPEPLTVVSDINEAYVYFSVTEKHLLSMTKNAQGMHDLISGMPEVELLLADGSLYPEKGKIETVSGVIDPLTGSVSMRATFPNKLNILRSGGTGNVLIPDVRNGVIIIPQKATYEIQDKKFVYLLTDSSTVKNTEVKISPLDNGQNYVVTSGLKVGDRLVLEGISGLREGMTIKAITPEESAAKVKAMVQASSAQGNHK